jgi:serine/threonine protein kinase/tetratricopeptide (TPR) repeat protein
MSSPAEPFEPTRSYIDPGDQGDEGVLPETDDQLQKTDLDVPVRLHIRQKKSTVEPRFQVIREHARGGMGVISVAQDLELKREVAFKEIRQEFARMEAVKAKFRHEAEITGRLEHPGIVPVYSLSTLPDGRTFYAMRFVGGQTLGDAIDRFHKANGMQSKSSQRILELRSLLRRVVDVCNTIAFAHSKGIIHRDIKPANVMLGEFGETLVVDWGLAKEYLKQPNRTESSGLYARIVLPDSEKTPSDKTTPEVDAEEIPPEKRTTAEAPDRNAKQYQTPMGTTVGTPAYMPPEQASGQWDKVGPASDVFCLGGMLFELLVGNAPLIDTTSSERKQGTTRFFKRLEDKKLSVPKPLIAIICRAMAIDPHQRYTSSKEMAAEIERWMADEPVEAYAEPVWDRIRRWRKRHRSLVAGLSGLVGMAVLGLAFGLVAVKEQQKKTEIALKKESEARALADQQQIQTLETLRDVVDDLDRRLEGRPSLRRLRESLLGIVLKRMDSVAQLGGKISDFDAENCRARLQLARVYLQLGEKGVSRAREQASVALELAEKLSSRNSKRLTELANAQALLVEIESKQKHHDAAAKHGLAWIETERQRVSVQPEELDRKRSLAFALEGLANTLIEANRQDEARKFLSEAEQILRQLYKPRTTSDTSSEADRTTSTASAEERQSALNLAQCYRSYARLAEAEGDVPQVIAYLNRALSLCIVGYDEDDPVPMHMYAVILDDLGRRYLEVEDYPQAEKHFKSSAERYQLLLNLDPKNPQYQRSFAVSMEHLGTVAAERAINRTDLQNALKYFEQTYNVSQELNKLDPDDLGYRLLHMQSMIHLSEVHARLGQIEPASQYARDAIEPINRTLQDPDTIASSTFLSCISECHLWLAESALLQRSPQRAICQLNQAFHLARIHKVRFETQLRLAERFADITRTQMDETTSIVPLRLLLNDLMDQQKEPENKQLEAQISLLQSIWRVKLLLIDHLEASNQAGEASNLIREFHTQIESLPDTEVSKPFKDEFIDEVSRLEKLTEQSNQLVNTTLAFDKLALPDREKLFSKYLTRLIESRQIARAKQLLERVEKETLFSKESQGIMSYSAACAAAKIFALQTDTNAIQEWKQLTFKLLEQAMNQGLDDYQLVLGDPELESVWALPEFQRWLERFRTRITTEVK